MLAALALAAALSGQPTPVEADDAALARLHAKAANCIESNAAAVEGAEADIASAVSFLVDDLCGLEIATLSKYRRNTVMLGMMAQLPTSSGGQDDVGETAAERTASLKSAEARSKAYRKARIDPDTGEIVGLDSSTPSVFPLFSSQPSEPVPDLRALAAQRLLAARRARAGR